MANVLKGVAPALTTQEAAKLLSVHDNTMRRIIQRGDVKAFRISGRDYRIEPVELQRFISGASR